MSRSERAYLVVCTALCLTFVASNVIAAKIFSIPGFSDLALPAGLIAYPLTFLVTDTLAEVWGSRHARFAVVVAFAMNLLVLALIQIAIALPPHELWISNGFSDAASSQKAYESVFSLNSKLLVGSLIAYMFSQLLDVYLFDLCRQLTNGRHLWLRNNVSTLASQVIDSILVGSAYAYWAMGMEWQAGLTVIVSSYVYKAVFAICDTPFLYLAVFLIKRFIRREPKEIFA